MFVNCASKLDELNILAIALDVSYTIIKDSGYNIAIDINESYWSSGVNEDVSTSANLAIDCLKRYQLENKVNQRIDKLKKISFSKVNDSNLSEILNVIDNAAISV